MSLVTEADVAGWREAVGRTQTLAQRLERESLRRLAVASGQEPGDVPVLAHWAWFLDTPTDREIGEDGHRGRGGFLPAMAQLPRRMFAASSIRFEAPLEVDAPAEMTVTIADLKHKAGRSGDLVFVEVDRNLMQGGVLKVAERQSLVYRAVSGERVPLPQPAADADAAPAGGELWRPGPVNLLRFSAVTFNGHRIHYDRPYATEVEGYPSLIVHGPFIAVKLAELAARDGTLASFEFRAQAPCFVDQPIRLAKAGEGEFQAIRCDGAVATIAKATYR
jgi:3-methylfumaryl-CoA hydratase